MLNQAEVVKFLSKPEVLQHEAFQILAAYIYCKSSRGNLPTETLAKILSIQRKIIVKGIAIPPTSPVGRAFEAAKTQLISANRKWLQLGPRALGPLGEIGSASSADAKAAWTKATDGKVTTFDDGTRHRVAVDAGRVVGPAAPITEAPPMYEPPPEESPLTNEANGPDGVAEERAENVEGSAAGPESGGVMTTDASTTPTLATPTAASPALTVAATQVESTETATAVATSNGATGEAAVAEVLTKAQSKPIPNLEPDLESGRAHLSRLREELLKKQAAEAELLAARENGDSEMS